MWIEYDENGIWTITRDGEKLTEYSPVPAGHDKKLTIFVFCIRLHIELSQHDSDEHGDSAQCSDSSSRKKTCNMIDQCVKVAVLIDSSRSFIVVEM